MIFARVEASRSYVGCLDVQTEVVASLEALCKEKGIDTAVITGYGYFEDPEVQRYSRSEKAYIGAQRHEGLFVTPTVTGSVSLDEKGKHVVLLFIEGTAAERGRSRSVAGQIVSATVRQFEFIIQTVDNVVLNRLKDKETGMRIWLQMLPAGMTPPPTREEPAQADAQAPAEPVPEEEEEYSEDELNVEEGDWLNHPRLGMCFVHSFDGEDRIKVRLQSGRIAELLMSMFRLSLEGVKEGGKVYKVTVRKRR